MTAKRRSESCDSKVWPFSKLWNRLDDSVIFLPNYEASAEITDIDCGGGWVAEVMLCQHGARCFGHPTYDLSTQGAELTS